MAVDGLLGGPRLLAPESGLASAPGARLPQLFAWARGWVGAAPRRRRALPSQTIILGGRAGIPISAPSAAPSLLCPQNPGRKKSFSCKMHSQAIPVLFACGLCL